MKWDGDLDWQYHAHEVFSEGRWVGAIWWGMARIGTRNRLGVVRRLPRVSWIEDLFDGEFEEAGDFEGEGEARWKVLSV